MALTLSGCHSLPIPRHDAVSVTIILTDNLPKGISGRANCDGPVCTLLVRRSTYPDCITHEVRHAFEGAFHGARPSSEDCKTY